MNEVLDDIGIPLCKGGVMARNPAWNGNVQAWRARIVSWTETTTPGDLLSVDIFFDFRAVHGDMALAQGLASEARSIAAHARAMVKLLADQLKSWSPPIGMFGRLITEEGRMDLKKGGLFPIVASARCLALSHAIPARATRERLSALREAGIGADSDLAAFEKALETLMELILAQQLADIAAGLPPSTKVNVASLDAERRDGLKEALRSLSAASDMVHDLLFSGVSPT
jgi:DNA polymerase-3 subunit epsilon/CBS domain-containing protein